MDATPPTFQGFRKERASRLRLPALAVAAALALAAAPLPALTWIIPGVANTPGINGVTYFSDLTLVNPSAVDLLVTVSLIPAPGTPDQSPKGYTVAGGAALRLSNVLASVWAATGTGALRVSAEAPVRLFARTDAAAPVVTIPEAPLPTFGTALPVVEDISLLSAGETGHSPWATQAADVTTGDRTNVAVVFPDGGGGSATATLFDDQGKTLGTFSFDSPRPAFLQRSLAAFTAVGVPVGRIAVNVTRGRACGYTATADAGTGDLTMIPTDRLAARFHSAVSSAIAQVSGADGTFWQTEARVANAGSQPVLVLAYLLGVPGQVPEGGLFVPAGATLVVRSLVTSMFHFSGAAAGEVLWTMDGPLAIATRTSTTVTLPFATGSAGDGRAAVPVTSFLTPSDGPADLGDLRSKPFSRTNLFLAAGPAGATYTLEARNDSGGIIGSYRGALPVLGWGEFRVADLFPSSSNSVNLRISVEAGSVNGQAGVVDAVTGDLVLYEASQRAALSPTPPLPEGIWGSADGTRGFKSNETTILFESTCQGGTFDQPAHLDQAGRFAILGWFAVAAPAPYSVGAILTGQTDGRSATASVADVFGFLLEQPRTYALGIPYSVLPPGFCPIEY